jgi:Tol biopolymer transport system component
VEKEELMNVSWRSLGRTTGLLLGSLAFAFAPVGAEEKDGGHGHVNFAESARAVVSGQYVANFQIATVRANGEDNYLTDQPNGASDPDWSSDGSRIYYAAFNDVIDALFWVPSDGGASTQVDTGCGADPDCLGDDTPAVSPNGRKVLTMRAFLPIDDNGNATNVSIFKMNIGGSNAAQITFPPLGLAEDHSPRWSPDGRHIVFSRLAYDTGWTIYIANSDGSDLRALTAPGLDAGDPDWSPDGKQIVFQSPAEPAGPSTPQQIYKVRSDGTHLVQLTQYTPDPGLTIKSYRARWSPGGDKIAFSHVDPTTTMGPDGFPHADILVMNPNGGDVVQVTHTPDAQNGAAWDPRRIRESHGDDGD